MLHALIPHTPPRFPPPPAGHLIRPEEILVRYLLPFTVLVSRWSLVTAVLVGVCATTVSPTPASAQNAVGLSNQELLEDFNHFVNIANVELAAANAQALIERMMSPEEFVGLIEDSPTMAQRWERSYRRAMLMPELEGYAAQLQGLYDTGRRARARDPQEIGRNISMLNGTNRQRWYARERLRHAHEYAVPQLLSVIQTSRDDLLKSEARRLLIDMQSDAVAPLSAALKGVDDPTKEIIASVLGGIGRDASLPYLYDLHASADSREVRDTAQRAIERIGGSFEDGRSVSAMYRSLGEQYYYNRGSLTVFEGEQHQLVWDFIPGVGLNPTPVRTEVFNATRAGQLAEMALEHDSNDPLALSLWLSSNFRRELDSPSGYENPAWDDSRRDTMYYAVASGSGPVQRILARALEDRDTRLARRAIEALGRSASGADLWAGLSDDRPLLDALGYPDRRVQYEAALAIGKAGPQQVFRGAERVVPILASAIRDASTRYAVVIANEPPRQQVLREIVEEMGYTAVAPARSLDEASSSIAETPGVDLVVADLPPGATLSLLDEVRRSSRLRATPALVLLDGMDRLRLESRFAGDQLTKLGRKGSKPEQVSAAIEQLVSAASGPPVSEAEAEAYAMAALDVLNNVAVGESQVLNVADASDALVAALKDTDGEIKLHVAQVLSRICKARVQQTLMDAALAASYSERVALLEAVTDSAKRCGNMLEKRHISRLIEVAESGTDAEATAAAALMGALNLPSHIVPMLFGSSE